MFMRDNQFSLSWLFPTRLKLQRLAMTPSRVLADQLTFAHVEVTRDNYLSALWDCIGGPGDQPPVPWPEAYIACEVHGVVRPPVVGSVGNVGNYRLGVCGLRIGKQKPSCPATELGEYSKCSCYMLCHLLCSISLRPLIYFIV